MKDERIVNMIIEAYITVNGAEKWNSLTAEKQHDIIMAMVETSLKALDQIAA